MTRAAAIVVALHRRRHPKLVQLRYTAIVRKGYIPIEASPGAFVRWADGMLEERRRSIAYELACQYHGIPIPFRHRAQDFGVMLG